MATISTSALIRCESVSKCYRYYERPADRLRDGCRLLAGRLLRSSVQPLARQCWALRDVSFEIGAGESVAVIGRNGSGKSTLLQVIAGTLAPSDGRVLAAGRISALLELGAGFHPEFTGEENIRIYATVLGMTPVELEERFDDILAFADIGAYVLRPVKTYSSGMYIRLAFSVAIHVRPQVLIVDEALAVGDIAFQAKCMARIQQYLEAGGSLLLVTHDVATVRSICRRAIYLEQGRIKDSGAAGPVVDHYLRDIHATVNHAVGPLVASCEPGPAAVESAAPPPARLAAQFEHFESQLTGQRQGTGEARIRLAELLDQAGRPLELVEFDATATIRLWIDCHQDCSVSVNYKIRDRNLIAVAGADLLITDHGEVQLQAGQRYVVEYQTRLPLMDGEYTMRFSITRPIARHEQAVFLDIVEVALPFRVLPSALGRIYTSVYLPNTVSVQRCTAEEGLPG